MLGKRRRFEFRALLLDRAVWSPDPLCRARKRLGRSDLRGRSESGSLVARYFAGGIHCATATVGRDQASLEDELSLEAPDRN